MTKHAWAMISLLLIISPALAQPPTTAPAISGALGKPIQIFNGKDLDGWLWFQRPPKAGATVPTTQVAIGDVWTVKDGLLHCKGKPTGYIRTEQSFDNYVLTVEQRHIGKGNGGILFAITGPDKVWPRCLEAQGANGEEGDIRNIADFKLKMDESRVEPKRLRRIGPSSEKPPGEWETIQIVVDHGNLAVSVNGQLQNIATETEDLSGKIGLQSEGGEMEFRKVELAPIESPGARSFIEHFDDGELLKRGWYDGERFCIVANDAAAAAASTGTGCIEYEWRQGDSQPRGSSVARRLFEPTSSIYVAFDLRLSKGWGWTRKGYHPHLIHVLTTESDRYAGPAATHLTLYIEPMDGKLRLAAQDIANKYMPHGLTQGPLRGGYNGMFFDSERVLFDDDRWHHVEAEFRLNTLDLDHDRANRDGAVRGWFDGELVVDRRDVVLRSTDFPQMKFNQLLIAPYFGPGLLPHPQTLWIDELTVAESKPSR